MTKPAIDLDSLMSIDFCAQENIAYNKVKTPISDKQKKKAISIIDSTKEDVNPEEIVIEDEHTIIERIQGYKFSER